MSNRKLPKRPVVRPVDPRATAIALLMTPEELDARMELIAASEATREERVRVRRAERSRIRNAPQPTLLDYINEPSFSGAHAERTPEPMLRRVWRWLSRRYKQAA
jgi:hypothetical protein